MTSPDDAPRDGASDPPKGTPDGPGEPDQPFDEAAAWRAIVENYGERAQLGSASTDPAPAAPAPPAPEHGPPTPPDAVDRVDPGLFDRSHLDALGAGRTEEPPEQTDHDHFVPPVPPPVPKGTPTRRLGWLGLFGPPLLMILSVVFGWTFPVWLSLGLVAAFIGGFVYLVATMPRDGGDGWDDGAVV